MTRGRYAVRKDTVTCFVSGTEVPRIEVYLVCLLFVYLVTYVLYSPPRLIMFFSFNSFSSIPYFPILIWKYTLLFTSGVPVKLVDGGLVSGRPSLSDSVHLWTPTRKVRFPLSHVRGSPSLYDHTLSSFLLSHSPPLPYLVVLSIRSSSLSLVSEFREGDYSSPDNPFTTLVPRCRTERDCTMGQVHK